MMKIRDLSQTYQNGVRALRSVSLDIPRGMFGLLGPNGAGKSTLMRTIATLQECDSGTIQFGGLDVLNDREQVRRILGYLPQEFGVYPRTSAEAMLDHFAALKGITRAGERRDAVHALLRTTNLWDLRKRRLGTFSGGMRQRFGIAQALLADPELIIVDEPTAGLDPEERQRFLNLLSEIGETVVVILSTHIVADINELCSRMAIIDEGRVLLTGDPYEIVGEFAGTIWRKVIGKRELETYERDYAVISTRLFAGRTLIHIFSDTPLPDGFEPVDADLEDVYFSTLRQARTAQ